MSIWLKCVLKETKIEEAEGTRLARYIIRIVSGKFKAAAFRSGHPFYLDDLDTVWLK